LGRVRYRDAHALQRGLHSGHGADHLLLLEHPHVYTLGVRADLRHVLVPPAEVGAELVKADRGGDVTYHGPGQLVGYPIFLLRDDERDLHVYLRNLEESIIRALAAFGLQTTRKPGWTGVWNAAAERKLASIGVAVKRWVTLHGFALNVATDLGRFAAINPCGLDAAVMGSMSGELGQSVEMAAVKRGVRDAFADVFARRFD
jgi:lipoate-protein ligase B